MKSKKQKAMKILIVDDDPMTCESIRHVMKQEGYEVATAYDALRALEIVRSQPPDLIISDVLMPGISGLSLLNMLKGFYLSKIPVIIISASPERELALSSLGMGADDYLSKPIDFKELARCVKKHLVNA